MITIRVRQNTVMALIFFVVITIGAGCATKGQTGALSGAGVGALVGGIAAGSGSELAGAAVGAGIGAGLGYLIGNEMDKEEAQKRQKATEEELRPLAGTTWQVVSVVPKPDKPFKSIVSHFRPDGTVLTTKTLENGRVEKDVEKYRIVGKTLIVNKTDYVINARFKVEGDKLYVDTEKRSIVCQRIDM